MHNTSGRVGLNGKRTTDVLQAIRSERGRPHRLADWAFLDGADDLVHGQAGPARIFADHALGETAKGDGSPFRLLTVGT
jgi:hypothetical protein